MAKNISYWSQQGSKPPAKTQPSVKAVQQVVSDQQQQVAR